MIELTKTVGQKLLFEGKYEYAIPAAMQSLKFSIDVYGLASIELVPSYLILGEACIGMCACLTTFTLESTAFVAVCTTNVPCSWVSKVFVVRAKCRIISNGLGQTHYK